MGDLTKNFSRREFACKCGCGFDAIDPRVVAIAQAVRSAINEQVWVNSGCRCQAHNKKVDGVSSSYHTTGAAADLACASGGLRLYAAIKDLYARGKLPGLEYCKWYKKQNFVHIDVGKKRNNRFAEG